MDHLEKLLKNAERFEQNGDFPATLGNLDEALQLLARIRERMPPSSNGLREKLDALQRRITDDAARIRLKDAARLLDEAERQIKDNDYTQASENLGSAKARLAELRREPGAVNAADGQIRALNTRLETLQGRVANAGNGEIDRLVNRAREDEEDRLYRDALAKLDTALDLIEKLKDEATASENGPDRARITKLDATRDDIRTSRRRLARKLADQEAAARGGANPEANRELIRALRDRNTSQPATPATAQPGTATQPTRTVPSGTTTPATTAPVIVDKDVRTSVRDVRTTGKSAVEYTKGEGIDKD
jgi:DNA repair exonuclease SbcCD ATPase subunit